MNEIGVKCPFCEEIIQDIGNHIITLPNVRVWGCSNGHVFCKFRPSEIPVPEWFEHKGYKHE